MANRSTAPECFSLPVVGKPNFVETLPVGYIGVGFLQPMWEFREQPSVNS
jgi:hypothetical protein